MLKTKKDGDLPVKHRYTAGGVVVHPFERAGRVLLMERDVERFGEMVHEIRLPKGKIEKGETDEAAGRREVAEETGYAGTKIEGDLGRAVSEFDAGRKDPKKPKHYVRHEHYFVMSLEDETCGGQDMDPDSEEALFVVKWVSSLEDAEEVLTYESEREYMRRARGWFEGVRYDL